MAIDIIVINDSLKTVIILSFSYLDKKNLSSYLYCYSHLNFESNDHEVHRTTKKIVSNDTLRIETMVHDKGDRP